MQVEKTIESHDISFDVIADIDHQEENIQEGTPEMTKVEFVSITTECGFVDLYDVLQDKVIQDIKDKIIESLKE
jgi:hypothetical protein